MPRYEVSVDVVRSYVVEVEAESPQAASVKVQDMELPAIEADDNYVDTHVEVDDEPDLTDDDGDDSAGATEDRAQWEGRGGPPVNFLISLTEFRIAKMWHLKIAHNGEVVVDLKCSNKKDALEEMNNWILGNAS